MDATGSLAYAKTPLKRRHSDATGGRHLPQKMRCCLPDPMIFNCLSSSIRSNVMADHIISGHYSGLRGSSRA